MKNYVYKLRVSGIVCDSLDSAVALAIKDIAQQNNYDIERVSKPIVVKIQGGYKVVLCLVNGDIRTRGIDVFVPRHNNLTVKYHLDDCYNTFDDYENEDNYEDEDEDYEEEEEEEEYYEDEDETFVCEGCGEVFCCKEDLIRIEDELYCKDCALDIVENM